MFRKIIALLLVLVSIFYLVVSVCALEDDLEILPADGYDVGDVDMDGNISILDATKVQMHLARLVVLMSPELELADTDFNGIVSISDATKIQLYLVGLTEIEKPTEEPTTDDDKPIELPFVPAQ